MERKLATVLFVDLVDSTGLVSASDPGSSWATRKSEAGHRATMMFVARDNRGGVAWETRTVMIR